MNGETQRHYTSWSPALHQPNPRRHYSEVSPYRSEYQPPSFHLLTWTQNYVEY